MALMFNWLMGLMGQKAADELLEKMAYRLRCDRDQAPQAISAAAAIPSSYTPIRRNFW